MNRELKRANGSMFAVHIGNPLTSSKRQQAADEAVLERHRMERSTREATRKDAFLSNQEMEQTFRDLPSSRRNPGILGQRREGEKRRKDFSFSDSSDEEVEEGIEDGLEEISEDVAELKDLSLAMNKGLADHNVLLDRLAEKVSPLDLDLEYFRSLTFAYRVMPWTIM